MTFLSRPSQWRPFGSEPGEAVIATGPCGSCGRRFTFHPDLVPSMLSDPETGRPPDVGPDMQPVTPDPAAVARSQWVPLCRACVDAANAAKPGHVPVLPGAYPQEGP